MYKLHLPMINLNHQSQEEIDKVKWLLKEIFGYSDIELNYLEEREFCCDIVTGITIEEGLKLAQPFEDYELPLPSLRRENNGQIIAYNSVGGLQPPNPREHYCDKPMVSREHLIDVFSLPSMSQINAAVRAARVAANVVRCPYCKSSNTRKISTASRVVSTGLFGLGSKKIGKQWHCGNCNSDF